MGLAAELARYMVSKRQRARNGGGREAGGGGGGTRSLTKAAKFDVHVDPPVQMDTSCKGIGDFQSESMDIWCAKNCGKGERYCEVTRCKCGGTPSDAVLEFVKALISRGKGAGAHITVSRSGKPKL